MYFIITICKKQEITKNAPSAFLDARLAEIGEIADNVIHFRSGIWNTNF